MSFEIRLCLQVDEAHNSVTGRTPADFQLEMKTALDAVGPIYAHIIMRCSEHKNPNRDRVFFEALYEAVSATCVLSMQPLISSGVYLSPYRYCANVLLLACAPC